MFIDRSMKHIKTLVALKKKHVIAFAEIPSTDLYRKDKSQGGLQGAGLSYFDINKLKPRRKC